MNRLPLRFGTRGSPLALAQTALVRAALAARVPALADPEATTVVVIRTTGDRITDRSLADIGGKGLFSKEIDEALLDGRIDAAVHSLKDLPTDLTPGVALAAVLPREDPSDALIAPPHESLASLPDGAVIGTSSLRRQAQLLVRRPDLRVVPLRGNVETRMRKVADGEVDATILAVAGLNRLGINPGLWAPIPADDMLPAACQGAIGVACRSGDAAIQEMLAPIDDGAAHTVAACERAVLAGLGGSCRTPAAVFAEIDGGILRLRSLLAAPEGREVYTAERQGAVADGEAFGRDAGLELRRCGGQAFIDRGWLL